MRTLTTTIGRLDTLLAIVAGWENATIVSVVKREPNVTIGTIDADGNYVKTATDDAVDVSYRIV